MTEAPAATEVGAEILTDGGLLAATETSITAVLLRLPSLTSTCSDTALASARLGAVNETESASVEDNSTAGPAVCSHAKLKVAPSASVELEASMVTSAPAPTDVGPVIIASGAVLDWGGGSTYANAPDDVPEIRSS